LEIKLVYPSNTDAKRHSRIIVETLDRHMNLDSGWNFIMQGGPPIPVINGFINVITPVSAVITPVTHL